MFKYNPPKYYALISSKGVWNSICTYKKQQIAIKDIIEISLFFETCIHEENYKKQISISTESIKTFAIFYSDVICNWVTNIAIISKALLLLALCCNKEECIQLIINESFIKKLIYILKDTPVNSTALSCNMHIIEAFMNFSMAYNKVFAEYKLMDSLKYFLERSTVPSISMKILRIYSHLLSHPSTIEQEISNCDIFLYLSKMCQTTSNDIKKQISLLISSSTSLSCDTLFDIVSKGFGNILIYLLEHSKSMNVCFLLSSLSAIMIKFRGSMYTVYILQGRTQICKMPETNWNNESVTKSSRK